MPCAKSQPRVRRHRRFDGGHSHRSAATVAATRTRASSGCSSRAARSRTGISRSRTWSSRTTCKSVRGAIFFFRDDQLTTQVQVAPARSIASPAIASRSSIACSPRTGSARSRACIARRASPISSIARDSGSSRADARAGGGRGAGAARLSSCTRSTPRSSRSTGCAQFEAADLAAAQRCRARFRRRTSAARCCRRSSGWPSSAKIRLAFIRVQRRPSADGPPPQSRGADALRRRSQGLSRSRTAPTSTTTGAIRTSRCRCMPTAIT